MLEILCIRLFLSSRIKDPKFHLWFRLLLLLLLLLFRRDIFMIDDILDSKLRIRHYELPWWSSAVGVACS